MINLKQVILVLDKRLQDLKEKQKTRRLDMADQDSANVSRYITATRWAVEQEIENMDNELNRLAAGIVELKKLGDQKQRYFNQYFVANDFECLDLGIISKKTPLGQEILDYTEKINPFSN